MESDPFVCKNVAFNLKKTSMLFEFLPRIALGIERLKNCLYMFMNPLFGL